jgi:HK97 family phage portal protein
VSLISGGVARLPLNVYRRLPNVGDDARELARQHPLQRIVRSQPNSEEDGFKFWRRFMVHALLWNNGFVWIEREASTTVGQAIIQSGAPVALWHLLPDRTRAERVNGRLWYVTEADGKLWALSAEDVLHVEGISVQGMADCDLVKSARNSIAKSLAREKFEAKFYRNGGRIGGILELPLGMPKGARDTVEEGFRKTYEGADNPFKTVILRDNAKFHAAQTSPKDTQLTEANESDTRAMARWFCLPPSKLGLSDSVSYNSKEEDNAGYLDDCLTPWLLGIQGQCNAKLLSEQEQGEYFLEHNTRAILRMRLGERFTAYQIGIQSRILSPNECRSWENLLPYEGGDEYENPNTSSGAVALEAEDEVPAVEEDSPEAKAARRRVLFNMTGRARRKATSVSKFTTWLDGNFQPHRDEWAALCPRAKEPEFFTAFRSELLDAAETVTPEQLPAAVDAIACNFERGA